jgi:hypothetical protein
MNENLKNFVNNIGLLCETWAVTYNKFREMGFEHKFAMEHTKEFMAAFLAASQNNGGKNE